MEALGFVSTAGAALRKPCAAACKAGRRKACVVALQFNFLDSIGVGEKVRDFERGGDRAKCRERDDFLGEVVSVVPVCASGEHVQLTVKCEELAGAYKIPGQFVQMRRKGGRKGRILVMASPPGRSEMQFLIHTKNDRERLAKLEVGEQVAISHVMGQGLKMDTAVSGPRLYMFADCAQGVAAMRAFVKWDAFRAASGNGTNRKTLVSIFVRLNAPDQFPYINEYRDWLIYGVDVVPVFTSFLDHFKTAPLRSEHFLKETAIACMAEDEDKDWLFGHLRRTGIPHQHMQHVTEGRLFQEYDNYDPEAGVTRATEFEWTEEETWTQWQDTRDWIHKDIRERIDARQVGATAGMPDLGNAQFSEAWQSWINDNTKGWEIPLWDDEEWEKYWDLWKSDRVDWRSKSADQGFYAPESSFKSRCRSTTWHWQNESRYTSFGGGYGSYGSAGGDSSPRSRLPNVDLYSILGIDADAGFAEVKKAYRTLAMKYHPDLNPNVGEEGENRMKMIAMAYSVLRDERRRQTYDSDGMQNL
mmetsp:Transcript_12595/g.38527  ORF Transcript_12595/g.38527 Transcript_12595/m.38527 type:complete len:529 (+) Transcript_12595:142-1728(+)|eukprot:CAMPEP_0198724728 /NCGR_PEP_ID=MMETSP1475-20131203/2160_1 /TAXON_ID= ORGANISM="Unidentified sp., Strain CCMP1999" /NCGR_SAMPLE_ID=MMETSP1475 /ASSEMBLY_ACC=CAM_ASM_001111 /LENGTH=528 /DNA_ID=CAMNT_0044486335 /DNA_START=133 /DNA_END=1719 /DNA_ORIENTATION=+